eukprot:1484100-Alexandrium_andersonii.AAC.1
MQRPLPGGDARAPMEEVDALRPRCNAPPPTRREMSFRRSRGSRGLRGAMVLCIGRGRRRLVRWRLSSRLRRLHPGVVFEVRLTGRLCG